MLQIGSLQPSTSHSPGVDAHPAFVTEQDSDQEVLASGMAYRGVAPDVAFIGIIASVGPVLFMKA